MRLSKLAWTVLLGLLLAPTMPGAENPPTAPKINNQASPIKHSRRVVLVVWDGMRPDFLTEQNSPVLYQLARKGVTFGRHHSVYPSATEVNGTAISTGAYPAHDGIICNHEYRPEIDPLKSVRTENPEVARKGDELTRGHYVRLPTLAEIVRGAGGKAVVAGAKPVALLADRRQRIGASGALPPNLAEGANVFAGATLPGTLETVLTNRYGPFPKEEANHPTRNDWTTRVLLEVLWADGVPDFSLLWMNEPDASQHRTGPGSQESLAGIRNADENLGRVLSALEAKGARDTTDIIVVSDHGCSTISNRMDVAAELQKAGLKAVREFKTRPVRDEILVVSNSGSTSVYVIGHERKVVERIVRFFQRWEFTGVIFTRKQLPGTFALSQVHLDSDSAPDVMVAFRWTAAKNKEGTPGMIASDLSMYGPGQGLHVSLSPFDMHGTLVAAGPDFRWGVVDTLASGNVDVAPTVLWALGIKPAQKMDGRVLTEALTIKGPKITSFEPRHLEASCENDGLVWQQYLDVTQVNGVDYFDEGNGWQSGRELKP